MGCAEIKNRWQPVAYLDQRQTPAAVLKGPGATRLAYAAAFASRRSWRPNSAGRTTQRDGERSPFQHPGSKGATGTPSPPTSPQDLPMAVYDAAAETGAARFWLAGSCVTNGGVGRGWAARS
jgi:hypothetical protein